jgi:hypothetical protein
MSQWDEYNILPKRFIDLDHSVLDEELSDPENNVYEFKEKVYFDDTANKFPLGKLKWARKTDNLQSGGILSKRKVYGYVPVDIQKHRILPEPFDASNVDENSHIVYIDGLLCYVPYDKLAQKRLREIKKADSNLADALSTYEDKLHEVGGQLDEEARRKLGLDF